FVECGMPDASVDGQILFVFLQDLQLGNAVDVYKESRLRIAQCHGGHQGLTTGQNTAVLLGYIGQHQDRLIDRGWFIKGKPARFHDISASWRDTAWCHGIGIITNFGTMWKSLIPV